MGEGEIKREKSLSLQISISINVKSSNMAYKLLSNEEKRLENNELIPRDNEEVILVVVVSIHITLFIKKE